MARKTTAKSSTALSTAVVKPDQITIDATVATIGDNSATQTPSVADEAKEEIFAHMNVLLRDWIASDVRIDYIQQNLARDIMLRHAMLVSANVNTPSLYNMALPPAKNTNDNALYSMYLRDLVVVFAGQPLAKKDCKTSEQLEQRRYWDMVNTRIDRALRLACNLAYWGCTVDDFDQERTDPVTHEPLPGAWKVPPTAFVPPGYQCGALMFELGADGKTLQPRPFVYLQADTKGKTYFANTSNNAPDPITLSLTQFNATTKKHIEVKVSGTTTDEGAAPQKAKRAAQQTVATPGNAAPVDDAATPTPSGKADRTFYIGQVLTHLVALGKVLAIDALGTITRADLTDPAWNALVELAIVYDRIQESDLQSQDNGKAKTAAPRKAKSA